MSDGQLQIVSHFGGELVSARDQFDAVARGTVDMCGHEVTAYHSGEVPGWQVDWVPFAWDFDTHLDVRNEMLPIINEKILAQHNTMAISWTAMACMNIWTPMPITKLEDMKGKKIRAGGGLFSQTVTNLGAEVVSMSSAEVYTALQRGVVDGAYWSWASVWGYKAYEILHYSTLPPVNPGSNWATINRTRFYTLPEKFQKIILDACEAEDRNTQENVAKPLVKEGLNKLRDVGLTFNMLSDEEIARWIEAEAPSREWYREQAGPVADELLPIYDKYPYRGTFVKSVYDEWQ